MAISRPFLLARPRQPSCSAPRCSPCRTPGRRRTATPPRPRCSPTRRPARRADPAQHRPSRHAQAAFDFGELDSAALRRRASLRHAARESAQVRPLGRLPDRRGQRHPRVRRRRPHLGRRARRSTAASCRSATRRYFIQGDTGWRVPAAVWARSSTAAAAAGAPRRSRCPSRCTPTTWVRDVKSEGTESRGRRDRARLRPRRPEGRRQGPRAGRRPERRRAARRGRRHRAVKRAEVDVWVGSDDHILRRALGRGRLRRRRRRRASTFASAT